MDGGVTALDLTKNGQRVWNIETGPGDLLSSTIHSLKMSSQTIRENFIRMIPSLNGGIYKFDGETIEAIPVTAEDLIKSSYKFSDDTLISGGHEKRTYGVNCRTGEVLYEQSIGGSRNWSARLHDKDKNTRTDYDPLLDDILVVSRHTQTVRASEPRSGNERWNFSIGHHELQFALSDNCHQQTELDQFNDFILDIDIRVIVPEGLICGYSKKDPSNLLWMHKFDSPIASVFRSDSDNVLYSVDLFKSAHWLWEEHGNEGFIKTSGSSEMSPSLYLGMYQQQFYIQESNSIRSSINSQKHLDMTGESKIPKIPFKPIPAANNALIDFVMKFDENYAISAEEKEEAENKRTELMTLDSQALIDGNSYVEGRGFYFYTKNKCSNDSNYLKVKINYFGKFKILY